MNKVLIDQAARALVNQKYLNKNYYFDDLNAAAGFLNFIVEKIEEEMLSCPNTIDGVCSAWSIHDGCHKFMSMLYRWTENPKYLTKE